MNKAIVLLPRLSEKTYAMSNSSLYVFRVDTDLNKHEIAEAVATTYKVTVLDVRTVTQKGKTKRLYRNRKYETGRRSDIKKAYVQLKEGDVIPVFASINESENEQVEAVEPPKKSAKKEKKEK